jgi:hypothetical protein
MSSVGDNLQVIAPGTRTLQSLATSTDGLGFLCGVSDLATWQGLRQAWEVGEIAYHHT